MDFNLITYNPFKEPSQHTNVCWVLGSMAFNLIAHNPFKNLVNIPMGIRFSVLWNLTYLRMIHSKTLNIPMGVGF